MTRFRTWLLVGVGASLAVLVACGGPGPDGGERDATGSRERFRFVDVAAEAGLRRELLAGRRGKDHLLDSAGAGAAWLDYDDDGWLDAYIVNGWRIDDSGGIERGRNALYRNLGDGTFEDVTELAGVGGEGHWGSGVAVADYDGDGRSDILVTNFGPNVLYRNLGDGTFENVAAGTPIEAPGWNTGAAFFDADADGDLDLYIATYIDHTIDDVLAAEPTLDWKGVDRVATGPFGLPGAKDRFFLSDGEGGFVEATERAGLADLAEAFGFAVRAADFDRDGDPDLYVANDSDANYFYRNDGDATFSEIGLWSGSALDANGAAQAGMGVALGDADGDGLPDLFVTNFSEDFSTLYRAEPGGFFGDASSSSGVGELTYSSLSWGTVFADLDNDGDLDLVVANGHIYPQVDDHPEFELTYEQPNLLLENLGDGRFVDATDRAGPGFEQRLSSRGLAAGDYDNDGDLDLLVTQLDRPPSLLRNDSTGGSWLTLDIGAPVGDGTRIGTEATLELPGRTLVRDLASGGSFLSVNDPRLHFGLGDTRSVERLEIRWPDGTVDTLRDVEAGRIVRVERGSGSGEREGR